MEMKQGKKEKILIVDPEIEKAREMALLFLEDGYDVEECRNVIEAVQKIKEIKFNCVIINIYLREDISDEVIPIIKTIDPNLKIIITTDENTKELEAKVRKQNIFYYHIRTFGIKELKLSVANAMKKQ